MRFKKECWKDVLALLVQSDGLQNERESIEIWAQFEGGKFVYYIDVMKHE